MAHLILAVSLDYARKRGLGDLTSGRPQLANWMSRISHLLNAGDGLTVTPDAWTVRARQCSPRQLWVNLYRLTISGRCPLHPQLRPN